MNKFKIELRNSYNIQKENIKKELIKYIKNKYTGIEIIDDNDEDAKDEDFTFLFHIHYQSIIHDEQGDGIRFYFSNSVDDYDTTFEITHTYDFSKIDVIDNFKKLDTIINDLIRNVLKGKITECDEYDEFYLTKELLKETKENIYTKLN